MHAAKNGDFDIVDDLINAKADPNRVNHDGSSTVHLLGQSHRIWKLRTALFMGRNIQQQLSPLHIANKEFEQKMKTQFTNSTLSKETFVKMVSDFFQKNYFTEGYDHDFDTIISHEIQTA